jgi:RNA recognition motif-containing protein
MTRGGRRGLCVWRWAPVLLAAAMPLLAHSAHAPVGRPVHASGAGGSGCLAGDLHQEAGLRLRGGGGGGDTAKELKIQHRAFVANLPRTLTSAGLREAFEEFGKVKEARVRTLTGRPDRARSPPLNACQSFTMRPHSESRVARIAACLRHVPARSRLPAGCWQVLKDIETGQSRRMGYVTFEDGRALTEAIEEMHETVCRCCACPHACARPVADPQWLRLALDRRLLPCPPALSRPAPALVRSSLPPQEFCTEPEGNTPAICTKLVVTEAKPEKQTW